MFGGVDSSFQVGEKFGFREGRHFVHWKIVHQDSGLELVGPLDGSDLGSRDRETFDHLLDCAVEVFHGPRRRSGIGAGWNR